MLYCIVYYIDSIVACQVDPALVKIPSGVTGFCVTVVNSPPPLTD